MDLYTQLHDTRDKKVENRNWIGNLRWFAVEEEDMYRFCSVPSVAEHGDIDDENVRLGTVRLCMGALERVVYRADSTECVHTDGVFRITMPWSERAAVIEQSGGATVFGGSDTAGRKPHSPETVTLNVSGNTAVWTGNGYVLSLTTDGAVTVENNTLRITGKATSTLSWHRADVEASALPDAEEMKRTSRIFWEEYLASCPITEYTDNVVIGDEVYTPEQLKLRQLWAWQVALVNMNKLEENRLPIYMAPDKSNWRGTWSNDGPETLCALSLTNQAWLVRECLVNYVAHSVRPDGAHSWYMHTDGVGCMDRIGDSGSRSHGVPSIVHAVEFYIRATGDVSILDEEAHHGMSVWEKLSNYLDRVFDMRDINNDGLIEWVNLWETGWDDKVGPFFASKNLEQWVTALTTLDQKGVDEFYSLNSHPVTPMVEQVYMLWALRSGINMARIKGEEAFIKQWQDRYDAIINGVKTAMWNEETGFYHDIDVKAGTLTPTKNADVFYYLFFERDAQRIEAILKHLTNKDEFALHYVPMCSRDSEGFSPNGYWNGGHWPREMSYIAFGLHAVKQDKLAHELLVRAICCTRGNEMAENLDPITGLYNTSPTKLAYCILNVVALLEVNGRVHWSV